MKRDWIRGVGLSMLFLRRGCGRDMRGRFFPGLTEAIDGRDYGNAQRWVGIIEGKLF